MTTLDNLVLERLRSLTGQPWVVYNTFTDLLGTDSGTDEVQASYRALRDHPLIAELIAALAEWPGPPLGRAYDPKDSLWKLTVLADFGLKRDDPRIAALAERLFEAQAEDGGFLHGGFDHTHSWDERPYICVDHVQTYALARFGYVGDPRLERAYEQIAAWRRLDGGWHPNARNLPTGDRQDEPSCPFGTINVLRSLTAHPEYRDSDLARNAAEYILMCWERRLEPFRPVGFGMGSTWDKLQYPFVQHQRLKTTDTLSQVPTIRADQRFQAMVAELEQKRHSDGMWAAEGISRPYIDFDFGQKKVPSAWITLVALRILDRARRQHY